MSNTIFELSFDGLPPSFPEIEHNENARKWLLYASGQLNAAKFCGLPLSFPIDDEPLDLKILYQVKSALPSRENERTSTLKGLLKYCDIIGKNSSFNGIFISCEKGHDERTFIEFERLI